MGHFEEKLSAAITEYNKYHAPEAVAELVQVHDNWFSVFFSGSFCRSCGIYDYFDDLRILLEDLGVKTRIERFKEYDEGFLVVLTIET